MLAKIVAGAVWVVILGWFPATFVFILINIWSDDPRWGATAFWMGGIGLFVLVGTALFALAFKKGKGP